MSTNIPADVLTNPSACARLEDHEWVAVHVPRYHQVRDAYVEYGKLLEKVFQQARTRLAPTAIVEVRAKKIPSFAEKILRKRAVYQTAKDPLPPDPLVRLTDLCGGRVVTQTAEEVGIIGRFIETAFDIDWANSEDVSQRLKPTEFGYRSVHYIVQLNPAKLKAAGIDVEVPPALLGFAPEVLGAQAAGRPLKAEIQVRTLLEHAAASLGHDTIYKTELHVPGRIKRDHATLAAVLEGVDTGFGRLLGDLKQFHSSSGAYHDREAVEKEIALLQIVLECESANSALAVRIAQHALAIGEHETAETVLDPFRQEPLFAIQRTLGQVLTEMHWDQPGSAKYREGQDLLEAACAHPPKNSEALCLLAESVARVDDSRARELFHEAIQADETEPLTLSRYLEFEIARLSNDNIVRLATPMIRRGMDRCRKQIEAGVNLPAAWASLAVFHLLVGEPFGALDAIAHVGALCQGHRGCATRTRPCAAGRALSRLRDTMRRLRCIRERLAGFDWCERAVLLFLAARATDEEARTALKKLASWGSGAAHFTPTDPIVILSGGCIGCVQTAMDTLKPHLLAGCAGLSFKLLCGGTTAGISGLAGDVAQASAGRVKAYGYLPRKWPHDVHRVREDTNTERFAKLVYSAGDDFTPLDPLQGWTDLIAAGIDPQRVKLLAYAGGEISGAECAVALALGARVGIIEHAAVPRERQFLAPEWQTHANLARLPMDAMTFHAFLLVDEIPLSDEDRNRLDKAAQKAHEDYLRSATPRDPSHKNWADLDESLKLSNFHQVTYWEQLLKQHGLGLRPLTEADQAHPPLDMEDAIGEDGIQRLAEMEHGRWNVERLLRGWRHAETKDIAKKLNPCLVPWPALKDINGHDYQPYDLKAIRAMPANFRAAGLELVTLSGSE